MSATVSHEPTTWSEQFRHDWTMAGIRYNIGSIIPAAADVKEQMKICGKVLVKGPYYIGKFTVSKHQ
jgi:hypothetical protein